MYRYTASCKQGRLKDAAEMETRVSFIPNTTLNWIKGEGSHQVTETCVSWHTQDEDVELFLLEKYYVPTPNACTLTLFTSMCTSSTWLQYWPKERKLQLYGCFWSWEHVSYPESPFYTVPCFVWDISKLDSLNSNTPEGKMIIHGSPSQTNEPNFLHFPHFIQSSSIVSLA